MAEHNVSQQKEIQETNCPSQKEYRSLLSPCLIPEEDASHLAVDDLKFALGQNDSRNIAVTGNYGSGKSSVANTCIDEMGIGDKVLRISMSTFYFPNENKPRGEDLYSDDIEYKIVQHLLYKCDKDKIPHTGFKLIRESPQKDFRSYIALSLLAIVFFIIAFEPSVFRISSFYDAYREILGDKIGRLVNLIADIVAIVYLAWFFYELGVLMASKLHWIRNLKVEAKGVAIEASNDADVSVFNKYLNEIIYIITSNQYDYILFEDLDRLDNSDKLFLKIRELNMLINESEEFKKRKRVVKFIYAIRDDVFTRELRTKCFDYIVAVVPVVDHYNVTDYLVKHYKKNGLFKTIDTPVLEQLMNKVSGLRELKNIVNEYILFEKSLRTHLSEGAENYEQKLLAVIVYKNLYPIDFAKVYEKKGLLYSVFQNKRLFYEGLTKTLREKLQEAQKGMASARSGIVDARRKCFERMADGIVIKSFIKDGYDYTPNQVANSDYLFELFENDAFDRYTYAENGSDISGTSEYDFKFEDLWKGNNDLECDFYEALGDNQEDYSRCSEESIQLEKDIKVIENTALRELIKRIGPEETKSILIDLYNLEYSSKKKELSNGDIDIDMVEMLQSLLNGGYITENYYMYISKFYEGSTSESDYQFFAAILQGANRPYDFKLNSAKAVVSKLRVEDFKNSNILNYDILNYLLKEKQYYFLSAFVETARDTPEFIVLYFKMANVVNQEFFTHVFKGWDSCINVIRGQEKTETSEVLLKLFFREAPLNIKLKDEEIEYLNEKFEFIHANIQFFNVAKLRKFVSTYALCFKSLVNPNNQTLEFYNSCLSGRRFVINRNNLKVILGEDYDKKPMTAILDIKESRLKNYLLNNQKRIVRMFDGECDEEDRASLVYMIKEKVAENEWLTDYLRRQHYEFESVSDLSAEVIGLILTADKLKVSWALILDVLRVIGDLSSELNSFITRHIDVLAAEKCEGDKEWINLLHRQLLEGEKQPMDVFQKLIHCFDQDFTIDEIRTLSNDRIAEIIKSERVGASEEIFDYLYENSTDEIADNYLINHFDELLDNDELYLEDYMRNSMGIHVLNSCLTLNQKKRFMDDFLAIEREKADSWELARLICVYYNECSVDNANKDLVIDALAIYQGEESWETKINLINKCNATWLYETDVENGLLEGLGSEYSRLTKPRGRAKFEINKQNDELLQFLKRKGHYVNNVIPREEDGHYHVTFKNR